MTQWTVTLPGEEDTVAFGRRLGRTLLAEYAGTGLVYLIGELGAGKTTLARGVLQALGHSGVVKSPTYTLLEPYRIGAQDAFHFDLYRVNDPEELSFIGFDEIIDGCLPLRRRLCRVDIPTYHSISSQTFHLVLH